MAPSMVAYTGHTRSLPGLSRSLPTATARTGLTSRILFHRAWTAIPLLIVIATPVW